MIFRFAFLKCHWTEKKNTTESIKFIQRLKFDHLNNYDLTRKFSLIKTMNFLEAFRPSIVISVKSILTSVKIILTPLKILNIYFIGF